MNIHLGGGTTHEYFRGELINLFVFCQPITEVYCGQLTNERARFLVALNLQAVLSKCP